LLYERREISKNQILNSEIIYGIMEQCGEKIIRKRKLCFNNSIREECMFTIWDSVEKKNRRDVQWEAQKYKNR